MGSAREAAYREQEHAALAPTANGVTAKHSTGRRVSLPPLGRRDDLQGLRAVAVLLVALGHAGVGFLPGGFVGVDVFFVLSGFLITGLLLNGAVQQGRVSFTEFYVRRARRILPAAALTLVATQIAGYYLLNFVRAKDLTWDAIWSAFFAANIHFARIGTDYFAQSQPPSAVQHFWSLAVEEQFYLVWPAVLAFTLFGIPLTRRAREERRWRRRRVSSAALKRLAVVVVAVFAASLVFSGYYTDHQPAASYFSTFSRAFELALGAALAVGVGVVRRVPVLARGVAGWVGIVAIGASAVVFSDSTPFPGYAALLPTLGAALVIASGIGGSSRAGPGWALSPWPMRFVGDRSYAFYLWHWPVLVLAAEYEGHDLSVSTNLALLGGAFVLSMISYALVEYPIWKSEWSAQGTLTLWPVSVAVVVLVAALTLTKINSTELRIAHAAGPPLNALLVDNPPPSRPTLDLSPELRRAASTPRRALPAVVAAVRAVRRNDPIPTGLNPPVGTLLHSVFPLTGCIAENGQTSSKVCRYGAPQGTRVVVFGDSHAEMWMPAILRMETRDRLAVYAFTKSGCGPEKWVNADAPSDCQTWFRWALRQTNKLRPRDVIVGGSYSGWPSEVVQPGIAATADGLAKSIKRIVVIGDPPKHNGTRQPVDCLLSGGATMGRCSNTITRSDETMNRQTVDAIASVPRVGLIETQGWFCQDLVCPMVVGHTVTYADYDHVTSAYAEEIAPLFRAAFHAATRRAPRP